ERSSFVTDCSIKLGSGLELQSHGLAKDAYASADLAVDRLEKRLRRYKRRLKNHHTNPQSSLNDIQSMIDYTVQTGEDDSDHEDEHNPIIIAETKTKIKELSVREAVMQLDLSNRSFLFFMNARDGQLNVVYQRGDGNIGWIDPGVQAS
ncbi:MAG: sigma 54 modulation/S30EA ribosomal C-terminal domain-containing protein, partial [Desulfobulbia bacterium]